MPLDPERLKTALAKTLQLFPMNAGAIAKHPEKKTWHIKLLNRPVELSVGTSDDPGPFAANWAGERHPGM